MSTPRKSRFTPRRLSFIAVPVALLVLGALFLGRSAATASPASSDSSSSVSAASTVSAAATKKAKRQKKLQNKVIQFTNKARKKAGCKPVKKNTALMKAALKHSKVQAKNQAQGHQFAGEDDLGTRITKAGYKNWTGVGENAAGGKGGVWFVNAHDVMYGGTYTKNGTGYTSSGWMQDKAHKDNIVNCSFTSIGVGAYIDSKGAIWWTQDFATKK
ncbi:CAP domain-containing protein [Kineosporia sp. J2-2]|uniref:CAP domain-containing protein n=1 Tax=Kineosporia corallincola TaxID=2835133 RepID=A0ABS5TS98_9ACTN|nr:CAP domain-containing protein [Kineosporia corallincola]MBT0773681.1 CAP domain-containing protein [Kineosporia corallincola]